MNVKWYYDSREIQVMILNHNIPLFSTLYNFIQLKIKE